MKKMLLFKELGVVQQFCIYIIAGCYFLNNGKKIVFFLTEHEIFQFFMFCFSNGTMNKTVHLNNSTQSLH